MALSTALMLAPSAIKLSSNLFGWNEGKKTPYEKRISSMADMLGNELSKPLTESTAFKSGRAMLDKRDKRNRQRIDSSSAAVGATDESRIGKMQGANEGYNQGLLNLLNHAFNLRRQDQGRYLNILGAQEGARQNRIAGAHNNLKNITHPLSGVGQALAMADIFGNKGTSGNSTDLKKAAQQAFVA